MELRKTLSHLQTDSCIESELFRAWIKGKCTQEEWATGIAVREGSNCLSVRPRVLPQMSQALRNYCEGRVEGRMQYDQAVAKKLGEWFSGLRSAIEFNQERLEHYVWAANKTKNIKAGDAHDNLCKVANLFSTVVLPEGDILLCLAAKKEDAYAREKEKRS